jgi:hypothetical protein
LYTLLNDFDSRLKIQHVGGLKLFGAFFIIIYDFTGFNDDPVLLCAFQDFLEKLT